ncbi:hypothetical protein HSX11_01695 [Oxalobacteraceae bacterium]|nr:hypothetical protein [Oxalobacteraceae bacterium]
MTKIRTAAPTVLAVTLAEAKASLRVDADITDMDDLVTMWAKGVIADAEHLTGQRLMEQTWEVRLPCFPEAISLPHPVLTIQSVAYIDAAGADQVLAAPAYRLNRAAYASTLTPARGTSWPATAEDDAAVVVTLQCGHGNTPAATPDNFRLYILAKLAEQFDPATRMERNTVQSTYLDGLLDACCCYA